jgi:hypothetical protein
MKISRKTQDEECYLSTFNSVTVSSRATLAALSVTQAAVSSSTNLKTMSQ